MEEVNHQFMRRCLALARLGEGYVMPNPMVGAVLVYHNRIIGEGYHQHYGGAHAEVNCIKSVAAADEHLVKEATLYVSLEPCAHFGKTPPCTDLIIEHNIRQVVIGCSDPFIQVNGKGIDRLQSAGIQVTTGVLEEECRKLNKRFFTFHQRKRPFIIVKWAQSSNQQIGKADFSRVLISNSITNRLVHQWRSHEAAILIGTNTALYDNPRLNVRHWTGKQPVRLIIDTRLRLPGHLHIFDQSQRTIIFNLFRHEENGNLLYYKVEGKRIWHEILQACFQLQLQSILVEGGTTLTQSLIDEGLWDECRIIENRDLIIENGLKAPVVNNYRKVDEVTIETDSIFYYLPSS